jgi:hypothetical protein
LLIISKNISHD